MANDSLSQDRFASIEKIERWKRWKKHQEGKLERLIYFQIQCERRYAEILSFKSWLKSWVDPDLRIEREQIVWEMTCLDDDVMKLKRLLRSHPDKTRSQWNHHFGY